MELVPKDGEYSTAPLLKLRIYNESYIGSRGDWALDGIGQDGRMTERVWTFDTWQECVDAAREFWDTEVEMYRLRS